MDNLKHLIRLPIIRQATAHDCGATSLQSVLVYYGHDVRLDQVLENCPTTTNGTPPSNILHAIRHFGLHYRSGEMTIASLKYWIKHGIPVIVLLQAWANTPPSNWRDNWQDGHYVVAVGYDNKRIVFNDPSSFKLTYLTIKEFLSRWHDGDSYGRVYRHWGVAIYGGQPNYSYTELVHMD